MLSNGAAIEASIIRRGAAENRHPRRGVRGDL